MPENKNSELFVPETPTPVPAPTKAELPSATGVTILDFETIKPNSVVLIKIAPEGMQQRIAATQQIAMALRPLREKIQEKNVAFIVMSTQETMDVLDPEQMEQLGWVKKEESRIIIPR